jgi:hypothetical protein
MDLGALISDYIAKTGLSQAELARRAGVSQSAVSRAITRHPARMGASRRRLVVYMQQEAPPTEPNAVLDAVRETWDGSDAHAAALAKLVLASRELWPNLGKDGSGDGK